MDTRFIYSSDTYTSLSFFLEHTSIVVSAEYEINVIRIKQITTQTIFYQNYVSFEFPIAPGNT